jgi:hypothetical protein
MNMFRTPESRILSKNTKMFLVHRSLTPRGNLAVESDSEVARVAESEVGSAKGMEEAIGPSSTFMACSTLLEEE